MWLCFWSVDSGMRHSIESITAWWEGHGQSRRYSSEALSKPNSPWKYPKFHSFCVLRQQCVAKTSLDYGVRPPTSYCFCNFPKPGTCSRIQSQGLGSTGLWLSNFGGCQMLTGDGAQAKERHSGFWNVQWLINWHPFYRYVEKGKKKVEMLINDEQHNFIPFQQWYQSCGWIVLFCFIVSLLSFSRWREMLPVLFISACIPPCSVGHILCI